MIPIDDEGAYAAKIRACMTTPCAPERCPRCGAMVGTAVKADGKRYLAEIEEGPKGFFRALKAKPHFVTCPGAPAPGVLCKGVAVRVVKGRKVPIGTAGIIIWIGNGDYGERVGIKDAAGTVHWTALSNVVAQ